MKAKKLFYKECHLAGRMYHDVDEVWEELKIGTELQLVRESNNRYDPKAIAVLYTPPCMDERMKGETFLLGYIPRSDNDELADFLDMGWGHIFECRISRLNPEAHYEGQVHLTIRIRRNEEQGVTDLEDILR